MVWVAVFFGRLWCMVCPLEWVNTRIGNLAQRLGVRPRHLPMWLRNGWLIVGLYAMIQMLVAGVHLHRSPAYTSIFLWSLLLMAAVVGLLFSHRAFCRGFCPVGLLIGTYGRGGVIAVRPKNDQHIEGPQKSELARSCRTLLNPAKLTHSRDCLMCTSCIKACDGAHMTLVARRPFSSADERPSAASWPVTLFIVLLSGFVTAEVCSESESAKSVFQWIPKYITGALSLKSAAGWIEGIWTMIIFPLGLWLLMGGMVRLVGCCESIGSAWRRLAMPLVLIIAAGHMAKGLAKFVSWVGFAPLTLQNPAGDHSASAIAAKRIAAPASILPMPWVTAIALAVLALALFLAIREARLTYRRQAGCVSIVAAYLATLYMFIVALWSGMSVGAAFAVSLGLSSVTATVTLLRKTAKDAAQAPPTPSPANTAASSWRSGKSRFASPLGIPNDELRMTNQTKMPNDEWTIGPFVIGI